MSWQDIYFNRKLTDEEIIQACSKFFNIVPEAVEIQHEDSDISHVDLEKTQVFCGVYSLDGDFPTIVEVIPLRKEHIPIKRDESVGKLCELLDSHALVTFDGDGNPYSSTLIRGRNQYQKVMLDSKLLDSEPEQIKIIKYLEMLDYEE